MTNTNNESTSTFDRSATPAVLVDQAFSVNRPELAFDYLTNPSTSPPCKPPRPRSSS